jgi:nucleoside-diphosphate-sugar epimerase
MSETVLVTGGSGFVAGWVIVELLNRGYDVRATVRDPAKGEAVRTSVARQAGGSERLSFVAADLLADDGWTDAAAGCAYVLHVASPMGGDGADDRAVVAAAVEGTERLVRAAIGAGAKRIVMTSSTAACTPEPAPGRPIDERDWTDPDQPGLSAYRRSKTLSERVAWDLAAHGASELATILPGAIFGPVLGPGRVGSVGFIQRLLGGTPPALPRLAFNITDVRDLARLHVEALTAPEAAGQRFIAMGEALWYADMARALKDGLGARAAKVPTAKMPDVVFRGLAAVQPQMKALLPLLGRTTAFSTENARRRLGYAPRPPRQTVVDTAESLLAFGLDPDAFGSNRSER